MKLLNMDCLEVLRKIKSNSMDSLVTDPPAGISFLGKDWDHHKGGRDEWVSWMTEIMKECLRVLKPGAHGLVWAIPRTSHWTATALENAGFEVRDVVTHLFGTGFPKSQNISKAIDKAAGVEREVIGKKYIGSGNGSIGKTYGDYKADHSGCDVTLPATDAAKQWDGWGTALKPASEHWILVRKPLSEKTIAKNVLKWGTGGINIDGCRIDLKNGETTSGSGAVMRSGNTYSREGKGSGFNPENERKGVPNIQSTQGRFPTNLVLDEQAAEILDEQVGYLVGAGNKIGSKKKAGSNFGNEQNQINLKYDKVGNASRFFYIAKASKKDRGEGNNHPTVKPTKLMEYLIKLVTPPNGVVLDPFMGSCSTGVAADRLKFDFFGIEQEREYFDIAVTRCKHERVMRIAG